MVSNVRLGFNNCSFAVTQTCSANRVGRTGFFFVPRALPLFDTNFIAGKNTLTATIVVIDIDKAQVNQRNEEIRFNYKFSFL